MTLTVDKFTCLGHAVGDVVCFHLPGDTKSATRYGRIVCYSENFVSINTPYSRISGPGGDWEHYTALHIIPYEFVHEEMTLHPTASIDF